MTAICNCTGLAKILQFRPFPFGKQAQNGHFRWKTTAKGRETLNNSGRQQGLGAVPPCRGGCRQQHRQDAFVCGEAGGLHLRAECGGARAGRHHAGAHQRSKRQERGGEAHLLRLDFPSIFDVSP